MWLIAGEDNTTQNYDVALFCSVQNYGQVDLSIWKVFFSCERMLKVIASGPSEKSTGVKQPLNGHSHKKSQS